MSKRLFGCSLLFSKLTSFYLKALNLLFIKPKFKATKYLKYTLLRPPPPMIIWMSFRGSVIPWNYNQILYIRMFLLKRVPIIYIIVLKDFITKELRNYHWPHLILILGQRNWVSQNVSYLLSFIWNVILTNSKIYFWKAFYKLLEGKDFNLN